MKKKGLICRDPARNEGDAGMREYPKHKHPHGINHPDNSQRIWVCEECNISFGDEEIRKDESCGEWGHKCPIYKTRCEAHLESYMPSPTPEAGT